MPPTHLAHNRTFRTSTLVPMSGRVILERLVCPSKHQICWQETPLYPNMVYCEQPADDVFVRVIVNDGVVGVVPGCSDGPGGSCALERWVRMVEGRRAEVGGFREVCGLDERAAEGVTFLHQ